MYKKLKEYISTYFNPVTIFRSTTIKINPAALEASRVCCFVAERK
jgi:hypothetical protein